jgi:hypothetical protein
MVALQSFVNAACARAGMLACANQASKRFSIANSNTMSSIKQLMCWSSNVGDAVKQQELGTDGAVLWSVDLVHCSHVLVESESALHIVSNSSACKIV